MVSVCAESLVNDIGGLLCPGNHVRVGAIKREPAPLVALVEHARFEQDPIGDWRRPVGRLEMMREAPPVVDPRRPRRADERRTLALVLFCKGEPELVLRIRLPGQAAFADFPETV